MFANVQDLADHRSLLGYNALRRYVCRSRLASQRLPFRRPERQVCFPFPAVEGASVVSTPVSRRRANAVESSTGRLT